jgi:hypothetical protein
MKILFVLAALAFTPSAFASGEIIECSNGIVTYQVKHSYAWLWGHSYQLVSLSKDGQPKKFGHAPGMIPNNCRARNKGDNGTFELLCAVSSDGPRWFDENEFSLVFNSQLQVSENKDGTISGLRMMGSSTVSYTTGKLSFTEMFGKKLAYNNLSCALR